MGYERFQFLPNPFPQQPDVLSLYGLGWFAYLAPIRRYKPRWSVSFVAFRKRTDAVQFLQKFLDGEEQILTALDIISYDAIFS